MKYSRKYTSLVIDVKSYDAVSWYIEGSLICQDKFNS